MDRGFKYNLLDNLVGYDDGVMTPGERFGSNINRLALALYDDPVSTIGGAAMNTLGELNYLMFQGGAEKEPWKVMGYAAAPMAPGALRGRVANVVSSGGAKPKKGIRAYHGSPHDFDRFSMDKIGTGEGKQAEGMGLYFAENPTVAEKYRDNLSAKFGDGHRGTAYEVNIAADPDEFVDWNAPLSGQPQAVRDWFDGRGISEGFAGDQSGMELLMAERGAMGDAAVAESMRSKGIPGIKYRDAGSRGMDGQSGTRNFVVFDENLIEIVRKYGIAGAAAMLGISAQQVEAGMQGGEVMNYLKKSGVE